MRILSQSELRIQLPFTRTAKQVARDMEAYGLSFHSPEYEVVAREWKLNLRV